MLRYLALTVTTAFGFLLMVAFEASAADCRPYTFEGARFIICSVDKAEIPRLRLFWRDNGGEAYRTFSRLSGMLSAEGERLVFAMNAGMYSEAFTPVGLYVEEGVELRPLDTGRVFGTGGAIPNFYKKPNGVFLLDSAGGRILPTEAYQRSLRSGKSTPRSATQSGPLLVFGNKLNPIFVQGSTDRKRRSGIGVCPKGAVRLAISEGEVSFHDFARLFRDVLGCPDALFLDGGHGTGLYDPALGYNDISLHGGYGPMLAFVAQSPR